MGSAFSKKKASKPQPSEVDKAILSLKTQRRKLGEYQRQVQEKIVDAQAQAQKCIRDKNKARALHNLKQKKIFQVRLQEIEQYLVNVEETVSVDLPPPTSRPPIDRSHACQRAH